MNRSVVELIWFLGRGIPVLVQARYHLSKFGGFGGFNVQHFLTGQLPISVLLGNFIQPAIKAYLANTTLVSDIQPIEINSRGITALQRQLRIHLLRICNHSCSSLPCLLPSCSIVLLYDPKVSCFGWWAVLPGRGCGSPRPIRYARWANPSAI